MNASDDWTKFLTDKYFSRKDLDQSIHDIKADIFCQTVETLLYDSTRPSIDPWIIEFKEKYTELFTTQRDTMTVLYRLAYTLMKFF